MAKRQTRRSISIRPQQYEALMQMAEAAGSTGSAEIEGLIEAAAKARGVPLMERADAVLKQQRERSAKPRREQPNPGAYFTF